MKLGAFSMSLNVQDIQKSIAFYAALGFEQLGGEEEQNWVILKNGGSVIGLFQGQIQANLLTFNPGWSGEANNVEGEWDDVRAIQKSLKAAGIALDREADESTSGPEYISLTDPDGNQILIDQHR